jgi:polyisoprenoid-binding protein YceI
VFNRLIWASLFVAGAVFASSYDLDPAHCGASFKVRHMMISNVHGKFTGLKGSVDFDPGKPSATTIEATISAATIDTGEPKRDEHLKSPDFFDVAKYPTLAFKSKSVTKTGDNKYKIAGDLTIHGVTKPVVLDVETTPEVKDPWGNSRFGASANTSVNRTDFGLTWNKALETGGVLVGDDIDITLELELVKRKAPTTTD